MYRILTAAVLLAAMGCEDESFFSLKEAGTSPGDLAGVEADVRRILASGVKHGGRFIVGDGNNVAPGTRAETLNFVYDLVQEIGAYEPHDHIEMDVPLCPAYVQ